MFSDRQKPGSHSGAMNNQADMHSGAAGNIFTKDFVLIFLAFFTFQTAYLALLPGAPIYFKSLGSDESEVGILVGAMGIAALISRFFVGAILTRRSEKRVLLFGTALSASALLACIVFRPFWPLFVVMASQGIAFASAHTAAFTYAVKTVSVVRRGQGLSYFTLATYFAMALAAPLGIFLVNRYDFTVFFLTFASLCVCSFFFSLGARGESALRVSERNRRSHGPRLVETKAIAPGIAAFLQMFVYGALAAFLPLYALGCGVKNPGLFFTASALVTVAGRAFGGRILDTWKKEKMIVILILIMMAAMIILSFSKSLWMFIFVGSLFGTGLAFFMPASLAYTLEYSGSSNGPAVATFNASYDLGIALGPAVMGLIVPFTGYPGMFLSLACVCLVNLCYFHFYVRKRCIAV